MQCSGRMGLDTQTKVAMYIVSLMCGLFTHVFTMGATMITPAPFALYDGTKKYIVARFGYVHVVTPRKQENIQLAVYFRNLLDNPSYLSCDTWPFDNPADVFSAFLEEYPGLFEAVMAEAAKYRWEYVPIFVNSQNHRMETRLISPSHPDEAQCYRLAWPARDDEGSPSLFDLHVDLSLLLLPDGTYDPRLALTHRVFAAATSIEKAPASPEDTGEFAVPRTLRLEGFNFLCACGYFAKKETTHRPLSAQVECGKLKVAADTPFPPTAQECKWCRFVGKSWDDLGVHIKEAHRAAYRKGQLEWAREGPRADLPFPTPEKMKSATPGQVAKALYSKLPSQRRKASAQSTSASV